KQIEVQRTRIQPQLDRIHREQDEKRGREEAVELLRGAKPVLWGGACVECELYLKQVLNDPDSYQHVESSQPVAEGPAWTITMRIRAKNAFGARIVKVKKFYIQQGEVVKASDVN